MFGIHLTGRLWHHRDFLRFWFSDTVSQVGNQFTNVAMPLIAVKVLGASPIELGIIGALAILPFPVLGLFVGVWADRFRKRRIMTICNLGRMVTLALIPEAFFFAQQLFSIYLLYLVVLVNGIFTVFFDISYQAYLPILIDKTDLIEGNSKLQISASGAQIGGPSLGGFVYSIVGGPLSILADAVGYLASALSLASIKKDEPKKPKEQKLSVRMAQNGGQEDKQGFFQEMKEGIHSVFDSPILRRIAGATATSNLGTSIAGPAIAFFLLNRNFLNFTPFQFGLLGTAGSVGFLVGVLLTMRITKRLGVGPTLAVSIAFGFLTMAYVLAPRNDLSTAFGVLAFLSFVFGIFIPSYNINQISLRQAITPNRLQGRMNATIRTIVWGTMPIGQIIGGILGDPSVLGVIDTILVGGAVAGLACLWIILGPVLKIKTQPEPLKED